VRCWQASGRTVIRALSLSANGVAAASVLYSASVTAAAPPPQIAATVNATNMADLGTSPEATRLGQALVNALGSINPIKSFGDPDLLGEIAVSRLVLNLDPLNSNWNSGNPEWSKMSNVVEADAAPVLRIALALKREQAQAALADALARRLAIPELQQLQRFFTGAKGQQYLAFQKALGSAQAAALNKVSGASPVPRPSVDPPPNAPVSRRLDLMDRSIRSQETAALRDEGNVGRRGLAENDAWAKITSEVAFYEGPLLDEVAAEYAPDLPVIDQFNRSTLGQHFFVAFGVATKAMSQQMIADVQSIEDAAEARFRSKWLSRYADLNKPAR
jgi:hypothetical protein